MVAIKRAIEPVEREQAKERQLAGRPSEESAKGEVRERVASSLGVSHDTLSKAEDIVEAAEQEPEKYKELLDRVDRQEVSVNRAHNVIRPPKERKPKEPKNFIFLPEALYSDMIAAVDEATANGTKQLRLVHDGHSVIHLGESAPEITTA